MTDSACNAQDENVSGFKTERNDVRHSCADVRTTMDKKGFERNLYIKTAVEKFGETVFGLFVWQLNDSMFIINIASNTYQHGHENSDGVHLVNVTQSTINAKAIDVLTVIIEAESRQVVVMCDTNRDININETAYEMLK